MQTMELLKLISANKTSDKPIEYIEEGFNTEDGLTSVKSSLFVSTHLAIFGIELFLAPQICLFIYLYIEFSSKNNSYCHGLQICKATSLHGKALEPSLDNLS